MNLNEVNTRLPMMGYANTNQARFDSVRAALSMLDQEGIKYLYKCQETGLLKGSLDLDELPKQRTLREFVFAKIEPMKIGESYAISGESGINKSSVSSAINYVVSEDFPDRKYKLLTCSDGGCTIVRTQ